MFRRCFASELALRFTAAFTASGSSRISCREIIRRGYRARRPLGADRGRSRARGGQQPPGARPGGRPRKAGTAPQTRARCEVGARAASKMAACTASPVHVAAAPRRSARPARNARRRPEVGGGGREILLHIDAAGRGRRSPATPGRGNRARRAGAPPPAQRRLPFSTAARSADVDAGDLEEQGEMRERDAVPRAPRPAASACGSTSDGGEEASRVGRQLAADLAARPPPPQGGRTRRRGAGWHRSRRDRSRSPGSGAAGGRGGAAAPAAATSAISVRRGAACPSRCTSCGRRCSGTRRPRSAAARARTPRARSPPSGRGRRRACRGPCRSARW